MKPGNKYQPLVDETMPSVTTMSSRIADDKIAFKELQRQLKTRGATTSAGIKQTLHDDLVIRFNEMNDRGCDVEDESTQKEVQSMPEDHKWSDAFKRRLNLSSIRVTCSFRGLSSSSSSSSHQRSVSMAASRGMSSQRALASSRGAATSQRSLYDKTSQRKVVPELGHDVNLYSHLVSDVCVFERQGR